MYYLFFYLSIVLALLLTPFLISTGGTTKTQQYGKIKNALSISLVVSVLISLTPNKAVHGAPLNLFGESRIAMLGCSYQISQLVQFCDPNLGDVVPSHAWCTNPNALATIAHCYETAHKSQIDAFIKECKATMNQTITRNQFDQSLNYYSRFAKSIDDLDDEERAKCVNSPIRLNDSLTIVYKGAFDQFLGNYDRSVFYGLILVGYWMLVFLAAAVGNWSKIIMPGIVRKMTGPISNNFRRHISLPATGGRKKTTEQLCLRFLDMLVPTRAETLILVGFTLLTSVLVMRNIHYFPGDPVFRSKSSALLRYIAVRTSILSSEIMPLLILFAGRNNFLQWVTRWDFATFIAFHRWISRLIFGLVVIHALCYSFYLQDYIQHMHQAYLLVGAVATVAGGIIMVQSLLVLRRKWYEIFLLLHIILAAIFIGGAWFHVNDLFCSWFYYYSTAVWGFDRLVRIGRLYTFGFPKAEVILLADETLKVIVPTPENWKPIPGGHVFIHFLRPLCWWQSHPFTYTSSEKHPNNIVLYIKVKKGITERLYDFLKRHPHKTTSIRVAVEGCYGESSPASRYEVATFIAGGNGIPGIYAEAYDLVTKKKTSKGKVKLIWVVREYKSLFWFYQELLDLRFLDIEATIYISKPHLATCLEDFTKRIPRVSSRISFHDSECSLKGPDSDELAEEDELELSSVVARMQQELPHITFKEGRPLMGFVVSSSIVESQAAACFVTCGHPVMVDELRAAVVKQIDNENHTRVDYFEQLQVWA